MLYQDLIDQLKKIKRIEDMTPELAQEIILAGITAQMNVLMRTEDMEDLEAFDTTRSISLRLCDMLLLDLMDRKQK